MARKKKQGKVLLNCPKCKYQIATKKQVGDVVDCAECKHRFSRLE